MSGREDIMDCNQDNVEGSKSPLGCNNCQHCPATYHCNNCNTTKNYCEKCFVIHQRFVPYYNHKVSVLEHSKPSPDVCQICMESPHAYQCTSCSKAYCSACIHVHNKLKVNHSHNVVFIAGTQFSPARVDSLRQSMLDAGKAVRELEYQKWCNKVDPYRPSLPVDRYYKLRGYSFLITPYFFELKWSTLRDIFQCEEMDLSNVLNEILVNYFHKKPKSTVLKIENFWEKSDAQRFESLFFESIALMLVKRLNLPSKDEGWLALKQQRLKSIIGELERRYVPSVHAEEAALATRTNSDVKQVFIGLRLLLESSGLDIPMDPHSAQQLLSIAENIHLSIYSAVATKEPPSYSMKIVDEDYERMIALILGRELPTEEITDLEASHERKRGKSNSSGFSQKNYSLQHVQEAIAYQEAFFLALELRYLNDYTRHNLVTWQGLSKLYKEMVENESVRRNPSQIDRTFSRMMAEVSHGNYFQNRLAMNTLLMGQENHANLLFCEFTFISFRYVPRVGKGVQCCEEYFYVIAQHTHENKVVPRFQPQGIPVVYDPDRMPSYGSNKISPGVRFFFNYRRFLDRENALGPKVFIVETVADPMNSDLEIRFVYYLNDSGPDSDKWNYVPYRSTIQVLLFNEPQDRDDREFFGIGF